MQDKQYPVLSELCRRHACAEDTQSDQQHRGGKEHGKAGAVAAQVPDFKFVGPVGTPGHLASHAHTHRQVGRATWMEQMSRSPMKYAIEMEK